MVFENKGALRYHALYAYTGLVALFVALDKVAIESIETLVAILAPIGLLLGADIVKHRNDKK